MDVQVGPPCAWGSCSARSPNCAHPAKAAAATVATPTSARHTTFPARPRRDRRNRRRRRCARRVSGSRWRPPPSARVRFLVSTDGIPIPSTARPFRLSVTGLHRARTAARRGKPTGDANHLPHRSATVSRDRSTSRSVGSQPRLRATLTTVIGRKRLGLHLEAPHPTQPDRRWCAQKLRQRTRWGSPEWIESFARRTRVEASFGLLKSTRTGGVKRGWTQQVGLVKTTFLLALAVASTNLRQVLTWAQACDHTTDPLTQMPVPVVEFEEVQPASDADTASPPTP